MRHIFREFPNESVATMITHLNESTTGKKCNGADCPGAVLPDVGDDVIFYNLEVSELLKVLLRPDTSPKATAAEGDSRPWNSKKSTVTQAKSKKRLSNAGDAAIRDISDRSDEIFGACCAEAITGVENGIMDKKCGVDEQCDEEYRDNLQLQRFLSDDGSPLSGAAFDDDLPVFPGEIFDEGCMEYLLGEAQRILCIDSPESSNESDACGELVELKTVSKSVSSSALKEGGDEKNGNYGQRVGDESGGGKNGDGAADEAMVLVPSGKSFIPVE